MAKALYQGLPWTMATDEKGRPVLRSEAGPLAIFRKPEDCRRAIAAANATAMLRTEALEEGVYEHYLETIKATVRLNLESFPAAKNRLEVDQAIRNALAKRAELSKLDARSYYYNGFLDALRWFSGVDLERTYCEEEAVV
jgi:hypothetical protein